MRIAAAILSATIILGACHPQQGGPGPDIQTFKLTSPKPPNQAGASAQLDPPIVAPSEAELILIEPIKAEKTTIIVNDAPVEKYWVSLTEDQRRDLLDLTETIIQVEKKDASGGITHAAGSLSLEKGTYRVSFTYMRYMNVPCVPTDRGAGLVRVGIGLESAMEMTTKKGGLNLGSIIPLIIAAESKKLTGNIQMRTIGMTTRSAILSGYLGQNLQLSAESLTRAMESLAVVRAVVDLKDTTMTSPNYLAVREVKPGACAGYVPRGTRSIGGGKVIT